MKFCTEWTLLGNIVSEFIQIGQDSIRSLTDQYSLKHMHCMTFVILFIPPYGVQQLVALPFGNLSATEEQVQENILCSNWLHCLLGTCQLQKSKYRRTSFDSKL
ncbi:hypothetical protein QE152_g16896 [Popillia japonica]|uniref:Uncharacterized protein n=1 Tax=Popillia japonica TaxID=7064 RepID=A0AAW1L6C3_POPJA